MVDADRAGLSGEVKKLLLIYYFGPIYTETDSGGLHLSTSSLPRMIVNDEYSKQLKCYEGGRLGFQSSLQPLIYTCCYARPLQQHHRTVAKTNLHLSVLITNPISDLIFKTMIYTYLRRVWPVEVVLASRPPGF